MSQKLQSDGGQKQFSVGRGLLAAAETLNFNMNEQRSGQQMGGMSSGMGMGGMEGPDGGSQMSRRGGSNLGSTMKLFASLGLSPSDLDALAEIPEEEISVETLPRILMQLKSRKAGAGERGPGSSMSSDAAYRGGRDGWDEGRMGRMSGPSMGQGQARAPSSADFGFSSMQDVSPGRGFGYSGGGGGGGRADRPYSELSRQTSYGGLSMGPAQSDFMQRRMGSPSQGKVQDFLGVMPPRFPHVCSLCDFDVHSIMEWNQHVNGLRHAENRRLLLDMYPDWDPNMASNRGPGRRDTPNLAAGLLGPGPMSSVPTGGMSSSWGSAGGAGLLGNQLGQNTMRSRVVVVKYDRKPLSNKTLFAFTEPFGRLREHLVLKNKAFLEMNTHEEARDAVNYYKQNPASLYGKPVTFYLSQRLMVIEKDDRAQDRPMDRPGRDIKSHCSKVVFFSHLPKEEEKKKELLTIAGRFGVVEKHLFLTDRAFIQMGTVDDAEMLVKYYTMNPLTMKGRLIRLNICTKYKTLNVNRRQNESDDQSRRSGRSTSPEFKATSRTASSKSSSRSREEERKEMKPAEEEEEEEEVVSGVMQGGEEEVEGEGTDGDAEEEEPERAESVKETQGGDSEEGKPEEEEEKPEEEEEKPEEEEEKPEEEEGKPEEEEDKPEEEEEKPEKTEEEEEKPEEEAAKPEEAAAKQEEVPHDVTDDVTDDTPGDMEAEGEVTQGAEPEAHAEDIHENKEDPNAEAANSEAAEGDLSADTFEEDFLENMEDFVTLDELGEDEDDGHGDSDAAESTKQAGMRVVNIVGFRRGYNFLNELLGLAKPFGNVVKHLVLDLRPEAYIQFETEEEARSMSRFYNSNVTASVCGRPVRVSHSMTYPTIQCGSSRVVYVGQIPNCKYTDEDILKLAEPYGKVRKYFLNRIRRECFIEMDRAEDAEKMAEACKAKLPRFNGKRLTIYVSRKYRQLKHGHRCPTLAKRAASSPPPKSSQHEEEEPPAKKQREEEEEEGDAPSCDVSAGDLKIEGGSDEKQKLGEEEERPEEMDSSTNQNGQTEAPPPAVKPRAASLPLPAYDPDTPIGVEHVKMGYYCRVCFLFYSNEDTAKVTHCSSQAHYDKLQKHLEKKKAKKTPA
ncbi:matrin 3-like 1.2 isoform 2-T5 [Odontesthes bonariensis]|uniref:matrin 3-like 1.2 isoform X2 n=1 Tax=Odontesthes bonariensis TaxID=219752 RepID=UPI003F58612B